MNRKYNKGLNIEMTKSVRKDKKRHIPKVKHKETKNIPRPILIKFQLFGLIISSISLYRSSQKKQKILIFFYLVFLLSRD